MSLWNFPKIPDGRPVLIAGPTASGKSGLALQIAERSGGVIVNADALQVYGGWRILTARPSVADETRAPHALYGHVGWPEVYSVGQWLRDLAPILAGKARPIIVGGTGLYFRALTTGLADIPPVPADIRAEADALTITDMRAALSTADPAIATQIDLENRARVQRAWEVWRTTGRPLSDWQAETGPPLLPRAAATALVVAVDRDVLNARIETRFRAMITAGALDEARANLPRWDAVGGAAKAIGAAELMAHLQGRLTREAAIDAAVTATRRYAKRQRTWCRANTGDWHMVAPG